MDSAMAPPIMAVGATWARVWSSMPGIRLGSCSGSRLARSVAGGGGAAAPAAGGASADPGATDTAGEPGPDTTPAPDPAG
ncbi:hypothetical protein, partial [Nocardia nova]|uniref:hypothetical protein n=1 Tax=Nocardia nova TaxID=37330 RepID=UPI001C63450E